MKKNIGIIALVLIVLVGGWYMMSVNQKKELPLNQEQVSNQAAPSEVSSTTEEKVLNIVSAESKATYEINEDLKGKPTHVVGNSKAISGTIILNASEAIADGQIKVDANSFETDIAMRDGNVKKLILKSDQTGNEFITFKTVSVEYPQDTTSAPHTAEIGKDVPVVVTGDMTISGVTKSVKFDGTAQVSDDNSVTIKAKTVITYADFGLAIPNFPFLANVDKTVKLSVVLVAR